MDKRLKFKIGENNTIATKKQTEPAKYDAYDPNLSDDEDLEDQETTNEITFSNALNNKSRAKKTSLAFKMQMMNQEKMKDTQIPNANDEPLSATKNIHKRFRFNTTEQMQNQKMESIHEVSPCKEAEKRKRVTQWEDLITEEKKIETPAKPGQFRKGSDNRYQNSHPLEQFDNQNSEIASGELEKQKKLIQHLDFNDFKHPFKHLIFSKNITERQFKRHLALIYRGLIYSKKCLKSPSEKFIASKQVKLPQPQSLNLSFINFI